MQPKVDQVHGEGCSCDKRLDLLALGFGFGLGFGLGFTSDKRLDLVVASAAFAEARDEQDAHGAHIWGQDQSK